MPSTVPDSLEAELVQGLAVALNGWDIASYVSSGIYEPDEETELMPARPIYFGPDEPANAPDERLLLTVRPAINVRGRIVATPVGFNWRGPEDGDPLAGVNLLGLLKRRLHRLSHYQFGTVRVGAVLFQSGGSIGRDSRRRPGATATYLFRGLEVTANT